MITDAERVELAKTQYTFIAKTGRNEQNVARILYSMFRQENLFTQGIADCQ